MARLPASCLQIKFLRSSRVPAEVAAKQRMKKSFRTTTLRAFHPRGSPFHHLVEEEGQSAVMVPIEIRALPSPPIGLPAQHHQQRPDPRR
jgi:hypothetical protein